jgi:hypothetical protein
MGNITTPSGTQIRPSDWIMVQITRPEPNGDLLHSRSLDLNWGHDSMMTAIEDLELFWKNLFGPREIRMSRCDRPLKKTVMYHDGNGVFQDSQFCSWVLMTVEQLEG